MAVLAIAAFLVARTVSSSPEPWDNAAFLLIGLAAIAFVIRAMPKDK